MSENYLGQNLIFIISQPRSGSTLLQRVLSGHPDLQSSAETWLMLHPLYGLRKEGIQTEYRADWARDAVEEFLGNYTDGPEVYDDAIRAWANVIYGNALSRTGKRYFLDKTPRYYFVVPDLYRIFPKAHFLFLLRNPMAVLASELTTYIKENLRALSLFREDLLLAPRLIMEGIDALGPDAIQVRYESFVSNPHENLSELCAKLGLSFVPEMLDYANTPAPLGAMNDPVGIHRHTRPSTDSVNRWKDMAADPQKRHFAQSYLQELGPEIVGRMGYSYAEILEDLAVLPDADESDSVFPWRIAIEPEENWTLRQKMAVQRLELLKENGFLRGNLASLKANSSLIWRKSKKVGR